MQRIEHAKVRPARGIEHLQHIGNTIICFCDCLQTIPEFASLGNEVVVRIDDEKRSDLFVKLQRFQMIFLLCADVRFQTVRQLLPTR
jgi:hypothetical protein